MSLASRKRRAPVDDDIPTPSQQRSGAREQYPDRSADAEDGEEEYGGHASGSTAQLAKSLVRYALACEYARIPIKRQDVAQKGAQERSLLLGAHSRQFRQVFDAANSQLLDTFGMEMVELPNKEKTTIRQKRAAAASESQSKTSNQWVLRNVLPEAFRAPEIIPPPRIPNSELESAYVGLYTMVIALISLSGGTLSEGKLDRFLKRMNAHHNTPVDSTEEILKRMVKEGYIVRVKDTSGDEVVDYYVGPRGKVEVGEDAVANMVRTVYSGSSIEDLEQRISRSLGFAEGGRSQQRESTVDGDATPQAQNGVRRGVGRPGRRRDEDEDEDD
ncbi:MAGE-domain-containing protein [Westerdykella ornata]|uniref:MAGE-domain-containing protein n=1 Tax=Westerdykella ornata TaxID=318751 RepID=A0A6A6JEV2_WESOR|nr:MAGE-domain-containing protein [Westerdykella ornata]KAF2274942.1 MAGE-domain-containing protein [Westerdykella ornata]